MGSIVAVSGSGLGFPSWGRSFWQDPNDGELICLYASGTQEVNFITSSDSGNTWSAPTFAFPIDNFGTHNNFDTSMDRNGSVHCVHRYNGSGCYTFLEKTPGSGWAPSGVVARGFFDCRATVAARDFNGCIEVYDTPLGSFPVSGPTTPSAFITAIPSGGNVKFWYVDSPYSATPTLQGTVSPLDVGPSGGFPVLMNGAATAGGLAISFSVGPTGVHYREHFFAWGDGASVPRIEIDPDAVETGVYTLRQRGYVADASYGPNMAWCRTFLSGIPGEEIYAILTNRDENFELYTTAQEDGQITTGQYFGRVDSAAGTSGDFVNGNEVRRLEPDNLTFNEFIVGLAGGDPQIEGTPVDISYYEPTIGYIDGGPIAAILHFYFLQRRQNGDQTIFRIKCMAERSARFAFGGQLTKTRYTLYDLENTDLGVVSWADASLGNAGAGSSGLPNIVHWHGFKASRSPVTPGSGVGRVEIVATIGRGITSGSGDLESRLYFWKFEDSVAASQEPQIETFVTEHTADSGNTFVGINAVSGITDAGNLFDGNTATSGQISNGDTITLEFSKALTFNRVEVLWNSPPSGFLGVDIESSLDNITYESVYSLPSGTPGASPSLVKTSAEYDFIVPNDPTVTADMDGFAGRYVRLTFVGGDAQPRDVREIKLYGAHSTAGFISTSGWESTLITDLREGFEVAPTGLPPGWRTYGDWDWFIDTGVHQSGQPIFVGTAIGSGSPSAIRTQRNSPPNTSGVLEVDINITQPRTVSYALKWDFQGNVHSFISSSDPQDDFLFLEVITPTGTIDLTNTLYQPPYVTPWLYRDEAITLSEPGLNTIRWIYRRGSKIVGENPENSEAAAWIDNVQGLDPLDGSPNLLTTLYAYMSGNTELARENVNAWASGSQATFEQVNGFIEGLFENPSEIINAYHVGEFKASGVVNSYIAATQEFGEVYGWIDGFVDTPFETINAYMITSGAFDLLYGHMQNRVNDTINAYLLGPSGALDSINAYIATPQFLVVNGYMKVTEKEQVEVNAYLKANGFGDQINGYMFASGLNTQSYGYIKADGALESINAYMKTGDDTQVYGFIEGLSDISGVINAWMSGIGAISDTINGYIPGISGSITGVINGFIEGIQLPAGQINSFLIGFGDDSQCNFPVPNPGFVSIPTGNFFT